MIAGVADTHAALWYLFGDPRLSSSAKTFIDQAGNSGRKIVLSVMSLAEILYLIEKNRLPALAYDKLRQALSVVDYVIDEAPLTAEIIEAMRQVPRAEVPDMPDRLVAATAVYFGVPIISRDGRNSGN
jgi:PIN domain nuclease of toxin-antitoxin system